MGDLSAHFDKSEFSCHCSCGSAFTIDPFLISVLESIRSAVDHPLKINSGFRCVKHNAEVGGVEPDEHGMGQAADIETISSQDRFYAIRSALDSGITRIGIGAQYLHIGSNLDTLPQNVIFHDGDFPA